MSSQTQNFKIGPCSITYKGELLGITNNSSTLSFNFGYYDVTCNKTHDQVLEKRLTGMQVIFKTEILEVDKGLDFIFDGNNTLTLDELGKRMSQEGGELLIVPINPNDKTAYRLPNAIVVNNSNCSFNTNEEYALNLEFEANYNDGEEILIQRLDADSLTRASLPSMKDIDSIVFERAMTTYIANKMNMTVDSNIFRSGVPINIDGCGVELLGSTKADVSSSAHYFIRFSCIGDSRDDVMETINEFTGKFPLYGEIVSLENGSIECKAIWQQSSEYGKKVSNDGKIKTHGEAVLIVII